MTAVVLRADARCLPLPDASVDLIVTSPPYFGLRSYTDGGAHYAGQIGSEGTPGEWLEALWACTAEWVRVLKPEGSLFVNLGDKYAMNGTPGGNATLPHASDKDRRRVYPRTSAGEFKPKSLLGLPWRYAIGCTDRLGLILRAEIIWAKPNGLPESVTDRVRRAHEQVFHFTKQPRYYAAVDEIREPHTGNAHAARKDKGPSPWSLAIAATGDHGMRHSNTDPSMFNPLGKLPGSVWDIPSQPLQVPAALGVDHFAAFPMELPRRIILGWSPPGVCTACGQGRRPVVDKPSPLGEVPPSSVERVSAPRGHMGSTSTIMLSGSARMAWEAANPPKLVGYTCGCPERNTLTTVLAGARPRETPTRRDPLTGRQGVILPPTRPAVVLDPFGGTGTTALVASVLGRHGITADLSADYCRLAAWRTTDPGERARARMAPKPPPIMDGQEALFTL